jgi:alpha-galactosidase
MHLHTYLWLGGGGCLCQNFNLEIVSKLILRDKSVQKTALTADQCLRRLSEPDAAAFVVPALAYAIDKALRFNFVFKSAMLQKCVYSTMLFTQREKFHQQAALLYEYQMTSETRAQLLPLIHYHYERTHNIIKRIEYLELVAEMHMANNSYADGNLARPDRHPS